MGFQDDAFQTDPLAFQMEGPLASRHGKYKPEHDSALADLGLAGIAVFAGFVAEHVGALGDLFGAGI
jgi:hypothetical protein